MTDPWVRRLAKTYLLPPALLVLAFTVWRGLDARSWSAFFAWPTGGIWSNLLASLIWAAPALLHLHRKIERLHQAHLSFLAAALRKDTP